MKKSSSKEIQKIKKAAIEAALIAAGVIMKYYLKPFRIREKKNAGLVTVADLEAEEKILLHLKKARPDFSILAEESHPHASTNQKPSGRWIIDPLDGTTNFAHGFPMFSTSIAAEIEGQVCVGVVYHPVLKEMYVGVAGEGAEVNGKKLVVSKTSRLYDSLLATGFTYRKDEILRTEMESFERLSSTARAIRRAGSAALDLAYTARGIFDGFWERNLSPWDIAAGYLLVKEAGGKISNFRNTKLQLTDGEILASNKKLHSPLLRAIAPDSCRLK